jgi:uncharacterized protein (DUF58 family)
MIEKKTISPDMILQIKQLQIFTRRMLNGLLIGDSRSKIKGTGFEFDQLREYNNGDDIRFVDWKSSARNNKLLVKQYIEDRSRTVVIAVDISYSTIYGSADCSKHMRIAQAASVLALAGHYNKDHVGLLLFSEGVNEYIAPGSSLTHVHRIIHRLLSVEPQRKKTDISQALKYLLSIQKRSAIVFLISDFIDNNLSSYLPLAAKKFDLIAVRCLDANEKKLPYVGFITVQDLETGESVELDTRSHSAYGIERFLTVRLDNQNNLFKKYGIDLCLLSLDQAHYLTDMIRFFKRRAMR